MVTFLASTVPEFSELPLSSSEESSDEEDINSMSSHPICRQTQPDLQWIHAVASYNVCPQIDSEKPFLRIQEYLDPADMLLPFVLCSQLLLTV